MGRVVLGCVGSDRAVSNRIGMGFICHEAFFARALGIQVGGGGGGGDLLLSSGMGITRLVLLHTLCPCFPSYVLSVLFSAAPTKASFSSHVRYFLRLRIEHDTCSSSPLHLLIILFLLVLVFLLSLVLPIPLMLLLFKAPSSQPLLFSCLFPRSSFHRHLRSVSLRCDGLAQNRRW